MSRMNRRQFMSAAAGGALTTLLPAGCRTMRRAGGPGSASRPNIIFLLTDDQRADAMGCAGNPVIQTPALDDLAANGVRFSNCFVTTSICASSRASIFSGQWTSTHGVVDFVTSFTPETLANTYPILLRGAGYRTGFIGKYGVGREKELPVKEYDYWQGFAGQGRYEHKDADGQYLHLTRIMGNQAIEFLRGCSQTQPFCLSVSFKAPHCQDGDPRQFLYDPIYESLYQDDEVPTPATVDARYFEALPEFLQASEARRRWEIRFPDPKKRTETIKAYYRLITGVDVQIRRIRAELTRLGLAQNTVIVFTGDNGFYLGEKGLAGKWYPHEESIRVPLIVYDPRAMKRFRGRVLDQMVLNVDIAPTILDVAGLKAPSTMQGKSLLPLLKGRQVGWRDEFFYEHPFTHSAIPKSIALRTRRYKYARYTDYNYEELYDLKKDPLETRNLVAEAGYGRRLRSMRKRCHKLAQRYGGA